MITSPTGKQYIGKCTISVDEKVTLYQSAVKYFPNIKRPILNAIRKYGWENMEFTIIERNDNWTTSELNQREVFWIKHYNTLKLGYNVTGGGDGHDSESAKIFWENASEEWKAKRSKNCSEAQKNRYKKMSDSELTRQKKRDSHNGSYKIISPSGQEWITDKGLKHFAQEFATDIGISYWQLFNAYRKNYKKQTSTRTRRDNNNWKVFRLDKSSSIS